MKVNPRNVAFFVVLFAIFTASGLARQRGRGPQGNPGPPPGVQPLAIDMFTSKNFYKDKANWMDKRYYRCNIPRDWNSFGRRPRRQQSSDYCNVGRLQRGLEARGHLEPVSLQDRQGTLQRTAGRSQSEGRHQPFTPERRCRTGTAITSATSRRRSRCRMDMGSQPAADGAFGAHTRISDTNGAADVSRGCHQFSPVERLLLLSGRVNAVVGAALRGRAISSCS